MPLQRNQVRIIAGKWRGRKIVFPNEAILKPTPDRIKETLFNWLAPHILGASGLDLFAGSGALGFEALSRGAKQMVALEKHPNIVKHLKKTADIFKTKDMHIVEANAFQWLQSKTTKTSFDIVFLDPPYPMQSLPGCCALLDQHAWVHRRSLIYLESNIPLELSTLPKTWQIARQKKAGNVYYYLAQKTE